MMNDCLPSLISDRLYLPQEKHHHRCMTHRYRMLIHRAYARILSFLGVYSAYKQYRIRIQPAISGQIDHSEYRNPKVRSWRSENQRNDKCCHIIMSASMKLFGIRCFLKTRRQLIFCYRSIACMFKHIDDDDEL
jgi:hypothetical protein